MDALRHPFTAGAHGKPKATVKMKDARLGNTGAAAGPLDEVAGAALWGAWPQGR